MITNSIDLSSKRSSGEEPAHDPLSMLHVGPSLLGRPESIFLQEEVRCPRTYQSI